MGDKTVEIEMAPKPELIVKDLTERRSWNRRIFYFFFLLLTLAVVVCIAVGLCWATKRNPDVDVDLGHNRDPRETKETWANQTYTIEEYRGVFSKWVSLSHPHRAPDPFTWENWKIATLSLAAHPPVTLLEKRIWFDWATWVLQLSGGTPSKYNWMDRNLYHHVVKELVTQYRILLSEAVLGS